MGTSITEIEGGGNVYDSDSEPEDGIPGRDRPEMGEVGDTIGSTRGEMPPGAVPTLIPVSEIQREWERNQRKKEPIPGWPIPNEPVEKEKRDYGNC
jgi:hypothetical protein